MIVAELDVLCENPCGSPVSIRKGVNVHETMVRLRGDLVPIHLLRRDPELEVFEEVHELGTHIVRTVLRNVHLDGAELPGPLPDLPEELFVKPAEKFFRKKVFVLLVPEPFETFLNVHVFDLVQLAHRRQMIEADALELIMVQRCGTVTVRDAV